jgi:hypothetical protein
MNELEHLLFSILIIISCQFNKCQSNNKLDLKNKKIQKK